MGEAVVLKPLQKENPVESATPSATDVNLSPPEFTPGLHERISEDKSKTYLLPIVALK